jgi:sugar phosphate isomerase/epimerase
MAKIALQLYSVRDIAEKEGVESTIRRVADAGYRYVESAGNFHAPDPTKAARLYKQLGLTVIAAHVGNPVGDAKNQVLDTMEALGKPAMIIPWMDPKLFATADSIKQACDSLNEGAEVAKANGMTLGYHNHWAEYGKTEDGQYIYQLMAKYLKPEVFFELDTYWIKVAGVDPTEVVKSMGKRAPFIHVKDGPANTTDPMTAVGDGVMDWKSILGAAQDAQYWIVEMDRVAGNSMVEAAKSYKYLKNLKI